MNKGDYYMWRVIISFAITIITVISASVISNRIWSGEKEQQPESITVDINKDMTVAQLGQKYNLNRPILKEIFNLTSPADLKKNVLDFGMNQEQINIKVNQVVALQAEHASKNWIKISVKGALWVVFLLIVFTILRKGKIKASNRKWIYAAAVVVFGIALGSDPSPMGTVKDALVLFGSKRVIFPPRLIAFLIFILMVVLANKFICSWGCQIGTLQDLIFRFNRDSKDRKGLLGQIKVPFIISNSIRIIFFLALTVIAFLWAFDIVEPIDPFKIFKPQVVGLAGGIFIGFILIMSLFIYRPWCHFFCPFGLVGWLAEKISIFKVKVDYNKCISCQLCSKVCPTSVMDAILKQNKIIPDCFSCGNCIESCPVKAISFSKGKRERPPEDKFSE
jgi:polyferredoxin